MTPEEKTEANNKLSKIFTSPKFKNYREIVISILVLIVVTITLVLIDRQSLSNTNNILLLITFWAIAWYSLETRELKIASRIANELNQEPILTLNYYPSQNYNPEHFSIKNDGKGLAHNIEVEPIKLGDQVFSFYFTTPGLSLAPGQERILKIKSHENGSFRYDIRVEDFSSRLLFECCKGDITAARFILKYESKISKINLVKFNFCHEDHEKNPNFEQIYYNGEN